MNFLTKIMSYNLLDFKERFNMNRYHSTRWQVYLYVINTNRDRSVIANLRVDGMKIASGRIFELAADPEFEVIQIQSNEIEPKEKNLPESYRWTFPPALVSAVELNIQKV